MAVILAILAVVGILSATGLIMTGIVYLLEDSIDQITGVDYHEEYLQEGLSNQGSVGLYRAL